MKKILALLVLSLVFQSAFTQSRAERRAEKEAKIEAQFVEIKALIESKQFVFEADWAIPLGNDVANIGTNIPGGGAIFQGGRVDVSSNSNSIEIDGNDANVFMQYFGRVFFPKRNPNENGIQFKGEIETYKVEVNEKKKYISITWTANPKEDFLKFLMKVNANGYTTVNVTSTNRQAITYNGNLKSKE